MDEELRRELERLAHSEATSGQAALAKAQALRMLERLDRQADADGFPVDEDGRFHPGPPSMWDLDRYDSDEVRERWRLNWTADRLRPGP
jgi:hypothetical protein